MKYFSDFESRLSESSQQRLKRRNPLRIFDSKEEEDQEIVKNAPEFETVMSGKSKDYFRHLKEALDTLGVSYEVDRLLVRGLDYYAHTCFEFKDIAKIGKA